MPAPIVCFVGKSGAGKTTFLEKLIAELVDRGYRVGVIKHDVHGFEIDQPGKDTWRLRASGACRVVISSPQRFALIGQVEQELAPAELAVRYLDDVDIVLAEGYKRGSQPKIELCRAARSRELICAAEDLVALVSDLRFDLDLPQFDLDDAAGVADLLVARFIGTRVDQGVSLQVDGRQVPLKPFIQTMLAGVVRAILASLKEAQGRKVDLRLEE